MTFPSISPKQSFPALESEILAYWKANNTFQKSIDSRPIDNPYRFYDGPPFITGTPHYGSLLSSIVKDVVGRYWTMRGKRVDRIWGWDCHGLPIEEKVQKKLGLKSNKEIEERGVKEFIDGCYEYTASTSAEWTWYIDKIGRWVDMDRAYRTMDQDYMESVMWVFSQLWNKGLIYEGKRVSLYSWKLGTPISNFEVAMDDTYQEVNDPAITVKFELEPNEVFPAGTKVLAWTTTPWTIPANMALAVRNDIEYVLVSLSPPLVGEAGRGTPTNSPYKGENSEQEQFIVAKNRAESVFKGKGEYTVVREFKGSELVGLGYIPPFPEYYYSPLLKEGAEGNEAGDFQKSENPQSRVTRDSSFQKGVHRNHHKIYHADFITDTDGTGIGHEAPEFGDVDFQLAKKEGIYISEAMDEAGKYTSQIFDYEGTHYLDLENPEKGANRINIERMKENGTLFKLENITHRVPFCPRSGTPLVQKAQASWFIDIQSQKDKLLAANEQINWFPEHLKHGRFAKGIESAPDWCISRTRYWGAPMPVWQNKDGSERIVISSRDEIFEMNKPYGQTTKLILVRHGRTDYNDRKIWDVIGKAQINDEGKIHAENVKEGLKDTSIDIIYSSPLQRALDTITPLADSKNLIINIAPELIEFQVLSAQEKPNAYGDSRALWNIEQLEGDETPPELVARIEKFLRKIVKEHSGKTIVLAGHYYSLAAVRKVLHNFSWDEQIEKFALSNKTTKSEYKPFINELVFPDSCTPFNLHKPYIDSILLANPKAEKAKKVLGIHGWTSRGLKSGEDGFWAYTKEQLEIEGITMDVPDFDKSKETRYTLWRDQLDTLSLEKYDTIVAHSLGCAIAMEYILEKKLSLKRLILVAPSGLVGNEYLEKIIPEIKGDKSELKKYVSEIIILHSKDDDAVSAKYTYGKSLAEEIGATLVTVDGFGHAMAGNGAKIVSELVRTGTPLERIPEVLDVWMDSGSMPYAQMHYPFENKGEMEASFPADFIAEYVGQVRAWFYVMHVLGVLLDIENTGTKSPLLKEGAEGNEAGDFQKSENPQSLHDSSFQKGAHPSPAFLNVITTGVINGNDGRKMSKSYGNYPDPRLTIEKYGADPIRFYMLNSPLLSGGDMDFKEEQIIETVKGVMLPIWNTYSFFTTYANIDNWEKNPTEVWFSRHGETTSNVAGKMSDGSDNPELTEKGREQARSAGIELRNQGKKFDIIIHTSPTRADNTAHIIGKEIKFEGEYILDDRFIEQQSGEYAGKTLEEIAMASGIPGSGEEHHIAIRKIYKNNSVENIEQYEARIQGAYEDILEKYAGKKILIIGHSGTSRPIIAKYFGKGSEVAHFSTSIQNTEPFQLVTTPLLNPLDRWIISKLQVLMGQVHDAMDGYDVSRACRAIVDYMDELTNWYVRLSRRRFWESGMTPDKASGYETLHTVLTEVSKLLAPFMPFISESIFQGLTGKESVHLEYATFPNRHLIDNDLNRDMERCEHIVSLGLALRSRKNIRVRQPLASVTITENLDEYYQKIICDELNVKEIYFENPEKLAKKICKPDARKIGPKYGKDVQYIIQEAKAGHFTEGESGQIVIPAKAGIQIPDDGFRDKSGMTETSFTLEPGEYTMEYLPLEGNLDVEGGYGMVVALDTTITEELKLEGYARDIIRLIQEMRKNADYQVTDRIEYSLSGDRAGDILSLYSTYIDKETLGTLVQDIISPDQEKNEEIDTDIRISLKIRKR